MPGEFFKIMMCLSFWIKWWNSFWIDQGQNAIAGMPASLFYCYYSHGMPSNVDSLVSVDQDPVKFPVLLFSEISQASLQTWDLQYSMSLHPCVPPCPGRADIPVLSWYWVESQFVPSICVTTVTAHYCATFSGISKKSLTPTHTFSIPYISSEVRQIGASNHAGSKKLEQFSVFQGKWKQAKFLNRSDLSVDCEQICLLLPMLSRPSYPTDFSYPIPFSFRKKLCISLSCFFVMI